MSYTILSIAYPMTPVGPDSSGGSEQVLCLLDQHLHDMGHRSLVIAVDGSRVRGELIPSPQHSGPLNEEVRRWGQRIHQRLLLETLNRYPVDLVHMHSLDFHTYLPASSVPTLATLHLPVDWYPAQIFHQPRRNFHLNCVSGSQQSCCPATHWLAPYIRNGIDLSSFNGDSKKEKFVLALGRICPEKGFHLALDAAREANVPMVLAGELFPYEQHLQYFQREIAPRLDGERQFIGPVGASRKRELLAQAAALLVPSLVAETSSLVTMEAMASGTPVVAFRVGALPELVEDGHTGFLVKDAGEMAQAIRRVASVCPDHCRAAALANCDYRSMGQAYVGLYERMLSEATLNSTRAPAPGVSWLADVS